LRKGKLTEVPIPHLKAGRRALFSHHQRSRLLQRMKTDAETHNQTLSRKREYPAIRSLSSEAKRV
ncbi:hypothetical protein LEMLEM_LOCUS19952, partial [Lemmus lemmus]